MLTVRNIVRSGFTLSDTVHDLISNGTWRWPPDRYTRFPNVFITPVPKLNEDMEDVLVWRDINGLDEGARTYYLWNERNVRLFNKRSSTVLQLIEIPTLNMIQDGISRFFKEANFPGSLFPFVWKLDDGIFTLASGLHLAALPYHVFVICRM
ncbi:hypothetical protein Tco_0720138 [Tanacetum coccineum]